jgi:DNA-binding beta-propeller fold protein YncE
MRRVLSGRMVAAAVAASALTVPLATAASAQGAGHHQPTVHVLSSDYVFPLQFAVAHGKVYVADSATSTLSVLGSSTPIATGPQPGDVAGVDVNRDGPPATAYTSTDYSKGTAALTVLRHHKASVTADLSGFEQANNPDAGVHYGVDNPSECVRDAFASIPDTPPATYQGLVDSHPYAVADARGSSWWVADAGGNDLLSVDGKGTVSLVAVLPRQPSVITAEMVASVGLPDCVAGVTYNFEPVPTDVEQGPHALLYVSTLPGGPEDPSFGARGSVYRVDPRTGSATLVATGFAGATNVAVDPKGRIYVAELFAGRISVISQGTVTPVVDLRNVAAVEYADGKLYASTMAPTDQNGNPSGPGTIVRIDL